jgi:hypothetical protein
VDNLLLNYATISGNNTFTGLNIFSNFCPRSLISATTNNDLTNKLFIDNKIALCAKLDTANKFIQTNTFDGLNIYNNLYF